MKRILGLALVIGLQTACGPSSTASAPLEDHTSDASGELSTDEILAIYAQNQAAIDLMWTGLLSEETTLSEATKQWIASDRPSANDVVLAIYAQNQAAIDQIWLAMGEATTLREATLAWVERRFDDTDEPSVAVDTFKLYSEIGVTPNPECDLYTALTLRSGANGLEALLVNKLSGTCELALLPNARLYQLTAADSSCGAKVYVGQRLAASGGFDQITITDNRTNTCEIPVPALFVVTEKSSFGSHHLYSYDLGNPSNDGSRALTLVCGMTDTDAQPYLTFIVKKSAGTQAAAISYVRSAFFGSEEFKIEQPIPGCDADPLRHSEFSASSAYVECDGDGDAGYISVKKLLGSPNYQGAMAFPNTGIEGYSDTSLPVSCRTR